MHKNIKARLKRCVGYKILAAVLVGLCLLYLFRTALQLLFLDSTVRRYREFNEKGAIRVAYFINVADQSDVAYLRRLLHVIYHPDDLYIIHLSAGASNTAHDEINELTSKTIFFNHDNTVLLDNPLYLSFGGFSNLLASIYGLAVAVTRSNWDYWIRLKPSDFPLYHAEEIHLILDRFSEEMTSFVQGYLYNPAQSFDTDIRQIYTDDKGLYSKVAISSLKPGSIPEAVSKRYRPIPTSFDVHIGDNRVILHRSLAEYIHNSPDNISRSLLGYFSKTMFSSHLFFQTLLCHPGRANFHVLSSSLHYNPWNSHITESGELTTEKDPSLRFSSASSEMKQNSLVFTKNEKHSTIEAAIKSGALFISDLKEDEDDAFIQRVESYSREFGNRKERLYKFWEYAPNTVLSCGA